MNSVNSKAVSKTMTDPFAVFIDVETTGLSPYRDEIIELAICLFEFNCINGQVERIIEIYSGLKDPGRPIPRAATRIHGIQDEDVQGKFLDLERINRLLNKTSLIIAHNASFDRAFVTRLFPLAAEKLWLCSMRQINWRDHGCSARGLANLLRHHGLTNYQSHRAQWDVVAALKLLSIDNGKGSTYLGELVSKFVR